MLDSPFHRVIEISQFREENRHAPPIQENMVVAPDELELIFSGAYQNDAHRRRFGKIETPLPVVLKELFELFSFWWTSTPVKVLAVQLRIPVNDLQGRIQAFPMKRRS